VILPQHYGVAHGTVRHALEVLKERELVVSKHGKGTFVAVVMNFSDREDRLAIDLTAEEAEALRGHAIGMMTVRLMAHDEEPVNLQFDVTGLRKGLGLRNEQALAELLERAEPMAVAARGVRHSRDESVSYATPDRAGEPHRGKTTDEEKKIVHDDLHGANARLRAKGMREISLDNPEHVARYGLEDLVAGTAQLLLGEASEASVLNKDESS
jgi:hypothetical protein